MARAPSDWRAWGEDELLAVKNFSMFEQASKLASFYGTQDLGSVSNISRRTFDERETFLFRSQVPCLEYVALLIENALLLRTNSLRGVREAVAHGGRH
jgi:hypothetical protein